METVKKSQKRGHIETVEAAEKWKTRDCTNSGQNGGKFEKIFGKNIHTFSYVFFGKDFEN